MIGACAFEFKKMADTESKEEPPIKRQKLFDKEENIVSDTHEQSDVVVSTINHADLTESAAGYSKEDEERKDLGTNDADNLDNSDNVSEISNLSGLSEEMWKPTSGALMWIQRQIISGVNPRPILHELIPNDMLIPDDIDDFTLWKIIINILSEPPPRKKLDHINTLQDVIQLLQNCKNIVVLTGAGVSVSCGIPDFRSRDGIYARLAVDFPDLPDPQAMFDINYFRNDPRPFFKFAKEIYPGQFEPSRSHKFISLLEQQGKLLRNYTQNIDTLEQVAGISRVIQCHGSFATATCMSCKHKVDAEVVREDIFNQVIPRCPVCPQDPVMSIMKPDIVFFGESLSDEFHKNMKEDKDKCDLLIVIGSSLKVRPVALIPNSLPENVPQILINREPLKNLNFDVELLGDCDTIIEELSKNLNWDNKPRSPLLHEIAKCELKTPTPSDLGDVSEDGAENQVNVNMDNIVDKPDYKTINGNNSQENKSDVIKDSLSSTTVCDTDAVDKDSQSSSAASESKDDYDKIKVELCEVKDGSSESKNEKMNPTLAGCVSDVTKRGESCTESVTNSVLPEEPKKEGNGDEDDLEIIRSMWKPHHHSSLAKRLGEKQYLFLPPSRYVFSGAEVYSDADDSDTDDESDDSSLSSMSDLEIKSPTHIQNVENKGCRSGHCELSVPNKLGCSPHALTPEEKLFNGLIDMETVGVSKKVNGAHLPTDKVGHEHSLGHNNHSPSGLNKNTMDSYSTKLYHSFNGGMHQHYEEFEPSEIKVHLKKVSNGIDKDVFSENI